MDHPIQARKPDLVGINKNVSDSGLHCSIGPQTERKQKAKSVL